MVSENVKASVRLDKKDFSMIMDVIEFKKVKKWFKARYIPAIIRVKYTPNIEHNRLSFSFKAWSASAPNPQIRFQQARDTSSFPFEKQYKLRIPVDPAETTQKIYYRIETYTNLIKRQGEFREVVIKTDLTEYL